MSQGGKAPARCFLSLSRAAWSRGLGTKLSWLGLPQASRRYEAVKYRAPLSVDEKTSCGKAHGPRGVLGDPRVRLIAAESRHILAAFMLLGAIGALFQVALPLDGRREIKLGFTEAPLRGEERGGVPRTHQS
ncbi:hypothetical protein GQ53DRAFT_445586 [Thozetella sp. PMI_491]|nr:hypothetical protein GQ53DRAFT_445586 [Thozetella sp. PMI_491]